MSSVGLQALFKCPGETIDAPGRIGSLNICPGEKSIALSATEVMKVLDNAESEFILQRGIMIHMFPIWSLRNSPRK